MSVQKLPGFQTRWQILCFVFIFFGIFFSAASVLFFKKTALVQAAGIQCTNGFNRPLLFGILPVARGGAELEIKELNGTTTVLPFNWPDFETSEGQLKADYMDFGVRKVAEANLTVVGWINGTPEWARQDPGLAAHKSLPRKDKQAKYEKFVREIVTRHRGTIHQWMFWNEPNGCGSNASGCGASESNARDYVYWLNVTYDVIKSIDPSIQVVAGNLDFTSSDTNYIRWMNNAGAKYDALSIHPYTGKGGASPQDFGRIRAAYDAQSNKKPIWIGEWGWDLDWSGMSEERAAGFIRDALREFAKPENSYIQAAFYHILRDEGGKYGLRQSSGPRLHGTSFKNTVAELCLSGTPVQPQPSPSPSPTPDVAPVCRYTIIDKAQSSNNSEQVLMTRASTTGGTFEYWFFNADNRNNSQPQPYCVSGQTPKPNDGCPAGSGQLVLTGSLGGRGDVKAQDFALLPSNQLYQSYWRGNFEWTRLVPVSDQGVINSQGASDFSKAYSLDSLAATTGSNEPVSAQGLVTINQTTMLQSIWQGSSGKYRYIPINNQGLPDMARAGAWEELVPLGGVPGTGPIQAENLYLLPNGSVRQIVWRSNEKYYRTLPVTAGRINFQAPESQNWTGPVSINTVPGANDIQSEAGENLPGNKYYEAYWRGGEGRARTLNMTSQGPDLSSAPAFGNPVSLSQVQNDGTYAHLAIPYNTLQQPDLHPLWKAKYPNQQPPQPKTLLVATTIRKNNSSSISSDQCIVTIINGSSLQGDVDKDHDVDIFDYNYIVQSFGTENCQVNILQSCLIDIFDFNAVVSNFGKSE